MNKKSKRVDLKTAEILWKTSPTASESNEILVNNGLKSYQIREVRRDGKLNLMVPMSNFEGKILNYLRINPDLSYSEVAHPTTDTLFFQIGELKGQCIITKGYENADILHQVTSLPVMMVSCLDDIEDLSKKLRSQYPEMKIIIAGEDVLGDLKSEIDLKYRQACVNSNAKFVTPRFDNTHRGKEDTDFYHLSIVAGPEAVKKSFKYMQGADELGDLVIESTDNHQRSQDEDTEEQHSKDKVAKLICFAENRSEFFKDSVKEVYAEIDVGGIKQCFRLKSEDFRDWLLKSWWEAEKSSITNLTYKSVVETLSAKAKFGENEKIVAHRIGNFKEKIYLDLADDQWRVIEIDDDGWRICENPPITFFRNSSDKALPVPVKGGTIDLLWKYVNIPENQKLLCLSWLIECFRRDTPDPLLELNGEQGSGKSITQSYLRNLIDPNRVNLRSMPQKIDDLLVPAIHSFIVSLENLSNLSNEFQDRLCSISTGSGFAKRTLYSDAEESVYELKRPVMLNGIGSLVTRPDLLDRTLIIELPRITEKKTQRNIEEGFFHDRPQILGGLLDLLSKVLKTIPKIQLKGDNLPRMLDFTFTGEAVYQCFGRAKGEFVNSYFDNRKLGNQRIIDESPVARSIIDYLGKNTTGYSGNLKNLLSQLQIYRSSSYNWVNSPKGLADNLKRYAPSLRSVGINVHFDPVRKKDGFHVIIENFKKSELGELSEHQIKNFSKKILL